MLMFGVCGGSCFVAWLLPASMVIMVRNFMDGYRSRGEKNMKKIFFIYFILIAVFSVWGWLSLADAPLSLGKICGQVFAALIVSLYMGLAWYVRPWHTSKKQ